MPSVNNTVKRGRLEVQRLQNNCFLILRPCNTMQYPCSYYVTSNDTCSACFPFFALEWLFVKTYNAKIFFLLTMENKEVFFQFEIIIIVLVRFFHFIWIPMLSYPVWLGRLTHLLREAQSHWPPFCLHSQLCKNDTRAAYQKSRMPRNWNEYFKWLWKLGHFQQA